MPPTPASLKRTYQPKWENGSEVGLGLRDCAGRYQAIRDYIVRKGWQVWGDDGGYMTVLDVGAYNGYFCRRLVDDFRAECTAVDNNPSLLEPYSGGGITVVPQLLNPEGIRELGRFDVTLCLSVLHHRADWPDFLLALLESAPLCFIETANPQEGMGVDYRSYACGADQQLAKIGEVIAQTPTIHGKQSRPLWVVAAGNVDLGAIVDLTKTVPRGDVKND